MLSRRLPASHASSSPGITIPRANGPPNASCDAARAPALAPPSSSPNAATSMMTWQPLELLRLPRASHPVSHSGTDYGADRGGAEQKKSDRRGNGKRAVPGIYFNTENPNMTIHFKRTLPDHAHMYDDLELVVNSQSNPIYSMRVLSFTSCTSSTIIEGLSGYIDRKPHP